MLAVIGVFGAISISAQAKKISDLAGREVTIPAQIDLCHIAQQPGWQPAGSSRSGTTAGSAGGDCAG